MSSFDRCPAFTTPRHPTRRIARQSAVRHSPIQVRRIALIGTLAGLASVGCSPAPAVDTREPTNAAKTPDAKTPDAGTPHTVVSVAGRWGVLQQYSESGGVVLSQRGSALDGT